MGHVVTHDFKPRAPAQTLRDRNALRRAAHEGDYDRQRQIVAEAERRGLEFGLLIGCPLAFIGGVVFCVLAASWL